MLNSDNLSVDNFGKICRTCLEEGEMKYLYKRNHKKDSIKKMLLSITFVQFSENDALPVQICVNCESELIRAYKFTQKCAEADKKLRTCLKKYKDKINNKTKTFSSQSGFLEDVLNSNTSTNPEPWRFKSMEPENEFELKTEIEVEEFANDINPKIFINKQEILEKMLNYNTDEQLHENKNGRNEALPEDESGSNFEFIAVNPEIPQDEYINTEKDENVQNENCVIVIPDNDSDTVSVEGLSNEENSNSGQINEPSTSTEIQKLQETEEIYECRRCFEKFATFDLLRQHRLDVNHPLRLNCKICAKSITSNNMVSHMKIHNKEMSFFCEICGKGFFRKRYLMWHLPTHTGAKPYKCDLCDKRFPYEEKLKAHSRIHNEQKRHVCNYCEKRFHVKRNLIRHVRIHTGERPFVCQFCERGFIQKISLDVHLRTHTGERPAVCEHCGKSFTSNGLLNWHMKIHAPTTRIDSDSSNMSKKPKTGISCAYVTCDNNSRNSKLSFFRFPKDDRLSVWVENSGRTELVGLSPEDWHTRYRLCSKHFDNNMFSNFQRTRLLPVAVPIMFTSDDVGN